MPFQRTGYQGSKQDLHIGTLQPDLATVQGSSMDLSGPPHCNRVCKYAASQNLAEGKGIEPSPFPGHGFQDRLCTLHATLRYSHLRRACSSL
jgi:hypothetical protein